MKGEDKVAELTWLEEHYINEGIAQGRAEGKRFAVAEIAKRLRNIGMNDIDVLTHT